MDDESLLCELRKLLLSFGNSTTGMQSFGQSGTFNFKRDRGRKMPQIALIDGIRRTAAKETRIG